MVNGVPFPKMRDKAIVTPIRSILRDSGWPLNIQASRVIEAEPAR